MDILFLGGIYTKDIEKYAHNNTLGPLQIAADTLQKGFLKGLDANEDISSITLINLPFVGSYPKHFKKYKFKPKQHNEKIFNKTSIINLEFNNFMGLKNISRAVQSFIALKKINANEKYIVCYSMHLPLLISIFIYQKIFNKTQRYYVIVPDLPEYMTERKGIKKTIFNIINRTSYFIVNRSCGISIITEQMANKFNPSLPKVVIEGISTQADSDFSHESLSEFPFDVLHSRYFLYTGTLDSRYGIRELISAYQKTNVDNMLLVICGDGSEKELVEQTSHQNPNIIYLGQVTRNKALLLQKHASILVNPRNNEGEYTAYSFPSKTIEYMVSGTPVLMYRLKGIPSSYEGKYYEIKSTTDLILKMEQLSNMSDKELKKMGTKARNFILNSVCPYEQAKKLVFLIKENEYRPFKKHLE